MYQVSVPESSENTNVATPPARFRLGWQVSRGTQNSQRQLTHLKVWARVLKKQNQNQTHTKRLF